MEAATGDAHLALIGAVLVALITAAGPIILALLKPRAITSDPPAPDLDLVAELDNDMDRLSRENHRLHQENEHLVRDNERLRLQVQLIEGRRPSDAEQHPRD